MASNFLPESSEVTVSVERNLLVVTVNRPEKRNALSRGVLGKIERAFHDHEDDPRIRVAMLTGAGEKCFAAGGDLRELDSLRTITQATQMAVEAKLALDAVRNFPVPTIAALNGEALGGGAELAVACNFRVAMPHVRLGFLQAKLAITTAWGGGVDLIDLVGRRQALLLTTTARIVDAASAERMGLIDAIAADRQSIANAVEHFIAPMLQRPRHVLKAIKALNTAHRLGLPRNELLNLETREFAEAWVHDDHWKAAAEALTKPKTRS